MKTKNKKASFLLSLRREHLINLLTKSSTNIVSIFLIFTLAALTLFMGLKIWELFISILDHKILDIAHDIAYIIVLIKAYRVLLFYLQTEHVSIKYIVEISIIAPAIEIIFANQVHSLGMNILFVIFGTLNLIIYLKYQEQLSKTDQDRYDSESIHFKT